VNETNKSTQTKGHKMHTKYKLGQTNNTPIAIHTSSGYGCRMSQSDFNSRGQIKVADKTVCTVSRYRKARKTRVMESIQCH